MKRLCVAAAFLAMSVGAVARADDDDDDPKSAVHATTRPDAKPAPKPELKAEPKAKVEVKPAPKPEAKADPKPEAKAAPKPEAKAAPKPEAKAEPTPDVKPRVEAKPKVEAKVETRPAKPEAKNDPKVVELSDPFASRADARPSKAEARNDGKRTRDVVDPFSHSPRAELLPDAPASPPMIGRVVRVRLLDGSTVLGNVRAELSEALVIDCNLGLLSIPRSRIAMVSYDPGNGSSKRAPVQQLDDDLPPVPKKH